MKLLLSALLLLPTLSHAGDKVLNGGGIWVCENDDLQITSSVLVDFYEAENEFKWTLVQPTATDPQKIADDILASVRTKFPAQANPWAQTLTEMRTHFNFVAGQLTVAGDSNFRAQPLPLLCRTHGGWQYRQFANWDDRANHGDIREDYWQSPQVSALDKAGLIWHEVVYRWLRVSYGDTDSTRAREIVGVLFAQNDDQFPLAQAQARLQEILARKAPIDPTTPAGAWVCGLQSRISNLWYTGYGPNQDIAQTNALDACVKGGDFMGMACRGMGISMECGALGDEDKFTCTVPYFGNEKSFTAKGRSLLEARLKALQACGESVGHDGASSCDSRGAVCQ